MKVEWRRHWPLAAALVVLWATIAALLVLGLERTGGRLVYYESWFGNQYVTEDRTRARWGVPLARRVIADNVVCGGDTVSFFALDPSEREALAAHLQAFAPLVPNQVIQSGQPAVAGIVLDRPDSP